MRPVIPLAVEHDHDHVEIRADGTVRQAARIIFDPEDVGRMKAGYVCARCWQPHRDPFPKECSLCGFHMSDRQLEFLGKAYKGTERVGPSTSYEDEMALMEEAAEIYKREQRVSVPTIAVPRSL